ncbi:GntR family transcriptional regulator [Salinarimonas ramus]|uniref:GntR family transcriptional regulator n=1 Tax=Salinarimonas ramus TaxID=690164 RepID=UPI001AED3F55|nr:GntR family transcriptional regulator [Salinarimonas ramus]
MPRLHERVYTILADEIGAGRLADGTRLTETQVAARFGVSRPPARQALARLAEAGLLDKAEGRGYRVRAGSIHAAKQPLRRPPSVEPLRSVASWERIYDEVESEIVARTLVAQWRIVESDLARHYGVSRTVARDVVGRLQQAGIVRKGERARWIAPALSARHVGELYEVRAILEPEALRRAFARAPEALLARMEDRLADALAAPERLTGADLDALEDEMHVQLLGHCGNEALLQAIRLHQSLLIAHRFLYRRTLAMYEVEPFLPEHREIVGHLRAGRVEEAAASLRAHLTVSRARAMARIARIREAFDPPDLPYLERLAPAADEAAST